MSTEDIDRSEPGNAERTEGVDEAEGAGDGAEDAGDGAEGAGDGAEGAGDGAEGAGDGAESAGDGAELLGMLALLADPTRRRLLAYIAYDNPEDVEDIPMHTGAASHLDEEAVEELLESLRRDHLPALESTGITDWDRGEQFDEIWPVLRLMIAHREELPDEWLSFADFDSVDEFGAARDRETDPGTGEN